MSFFKQLSELIPGTKLNVTIMEKNGKLTISVLPDGIDKVQPVILTGTPEELDEGFIAAITKPLADATGVRVDVEEYNKSLKEAKPSASAKPATKPAVKKKDETEEEEATEPEEKPAGKPAKKAKPATPAKTDKTVNLFADLPEEEDSKEYQEEEKSPSEEEPETQGADAEKAEEVTE